jgi:hypothetical protein
MPMLARSLLLVARLQEAKNERAEQHTDQYDLHSAQPDATALIHTKYPPWLMVRCSARDLRLARHDTFIIPDVCYGR